MKKLGNQPPPTIPGMPIGAATVAIKICPRQAVQAACFRRCFFWWL
jgi:hypothetical protein